MDKKKIDLSFDLIKIGLFFLVFNYFFLNNNQKIMLFSTASAVGGILILLFLKFNKKKKFQRAELSTISKMSGDEFEEYTAFLLRNMGFEKVEVTSSQRDQGIDVMAQRNNVKFGFQCKRWKGNVGNKAIQEVYAGKGFYKLDKAIVITNSYFTKSAIELADKLEVELWNKESLVKILTKVKEESGIEHTPNNV